MKAWKAGLAGAPCCVLFVARQVSLHAGSRPTRLGQLPEHQPHEPAHRHPAQHHRCAVHGPRILPPSGQACMLIIDLA